MAIEYKITFENKTGGEGASSPISGDYTQSDTAVAQNTSQATNEAQRAESVVAGLVAYKTVKNFTSQIVNNEISLVQLRTGSNEMQERANYTNKWVQKGVSILEAGAGGAMVGGAYGAAIGAGLALVSTITSSAMSYLQNKQRIDLSRDLENVSLQMEYIRAGATGSRTQ